MVYLDADIKVSDRNGDLDIGVIDRLGSKFVVAIYIRVSPKGTGKQKAEKRSLDIQQKECLEELEKYGWGFYKIYREVVSGSIAFENRLEGGKLLAGAKEGKFNLVIIWDSDRLGRDMEGLAAKLFRSQMRLLGVQIYSKNQPHQLKNPKEYVEDPYDDGQILLENIHDWQSSSKITKFRRRSIKGKIKRVKGGKMINTPLYGYMWEKKRDKNGDVVVRKDGRVVNIRVISSDEAKMVVRVYHEYTVDGKSMNEIRDGLNRDGISTRKGRSWERAMVGRILKNPVYWGSLVYNKYHRRKDPLTSKTKYGKNPPEKWIVVPPKITEHDAIISKEVFEKAQEIIKSRLRLGAVAVYSDFLFSGIGLCEVCGSVLYRTKVKSYYTRQSDGKTTKSQSNGYVCGRWRRFKDTERIYVSERDLKNVVLKDLKKFKDNPSVLKGYLKESERKDLEVKEGILATKIKALSKIDTRYNRLLKAYELEKLTLEKFDSRVRELQEEEKILQKEVIELREVLGDSKRSEVGKADFIKAVNNFEEVFEKGDIKDQKRFLQSLIENIVVGKDKIKINYWLGN
jgi:site-specific DNA recombinase